MLHYDFSKVPEENWKDEESDMGISSLAQAMIFHTMITGINRITTESAEELAKRARMWESLAGALRKIHHENDWIDAPLEYEDVISFVGLSTNAATLTRKQFFDKVWEHLL